MCERSAPNSAPGIDGIHITNMTFCSADETRIGQAGLSGPINTI